MAGCGAPLPELERLVEVMARLRRECPWDAQQTHRSLVQYLIEETAETVEAIEADDHDHLREELGDLLLQVIFHAEIAAAERPRLRRGGRGPGDRRQAGRPASVRVRHGRGAERPELHLGAAQGGREGPDARCCRASRSSCRHWPGRTRSSAAAGPGGCRWPCRTSRSPPSRSARTARPGRPGAGERDRPRPGRPRRGAPVGAAGGRGRVRRSLIRVVRASGRGAGRSGCCCRTGRGSRSRCRSSARSAPRRARRPWP